MVERVAVKCGACEKDITNKTEVEYSGFLTEYFCNPDCATDRYFDYMQSTPFQFEKDKMRERKLTLKNDKLYEIL